MRKTPAPLPAKPTAVKTAPIKTAPIKTAPIKTAPSKTASIKTVSAKPAPVKPAPKKLSAVKPAAPLAKTIAETPATYFAGAAGRAWRMSGKHAVAYVHTAALAGELLATEPRQVAGAAMAVYYDRKGRPFAWQFRFDAARWAEVTQRLG